MVNSNFGLLPPHLSHLAHTHAAVPDNQMENSEIKTTLFSGVVAQDNLAYLKKCCLMSSIEEQQAEAEASGAHELKNILEEIHFEMKQSYSMDDAGHTDNAECHNLYNHLQSMYVKSESTSAYKNNVARLQPLAASTNNNIDITSLARDVSKTLVKLKQEKLEKSEFIIKKHIFQSIENDNPQYSKDVSYYYLKKNKASAISDLISNKKITGFTRNSLREELTSNKMRCKETRYNIEILRKKQDISALEKKISSSNDLIELENKKFNDEIADKKNSIKMEIDTLSTHINDLKSEKTHENNKSKRNEINSKITSLIEKKNVLIEKYNNFKNTSEVNEINKKRDIKIDKIQSNLNKNITEYKSLKEETNELFKAQHVVMMHQDKSIDDCYMKKSALSIDVKNALKYDLKSVGVLYADLCKDKIEASSYITKIDSARKIKPTILKKLDRIDHHKIDELSKAEIKDIDFKISKTKIDKKIALLNAEKDNISERITKVKADIDNIKFIINKDHADKISHSTDFLCIAKDNNSEIFYEKQINNGTCTLHRNNAIIANLTHGTEMEQTPYRIESLITAETTINANDKISALLNKIDSGTLPTLKELEAAINAIKNNVKVSANGRQNQIANGYIMDYVNTEGKDRKIKSNNINAADHSIMFEHGFSQSDITPKNIEYSRGSEISNETMSNLSQYDALMISLSGKKEGADRNHAVGIIKKENNYFFMDSNKQPVRASIEDIFSVLLKKETDNTLSAQLKDLHSYYSSYDKIIVRYALNSPS